MTLTAESSFLSAQRGCRLINPFLGLSHTQFDYETNVTMKRTRFLGGISTGGVLSAGKMIRPHILLGARVKAVVVPEKEKFESSDSAGFISAPDEEQKALDVLMEVMPYWEVMMPGDSRFVPFFMTGAGISIRYARFESDVEGVMKERTISGVGQIGGGIHTFLNPRCSIDLSAAALLEFGKAKYGSSFEDGTEVSVMHIGLETALGISAWL